MTHISTRSLLLVFCSALIILAACSSPRSGMRGTPEQRLMTVYQEWRGVPYQLGGMTKSGVDCSAFVQITMRRAFGLDLPRVTSDQIKEGRRVRPNRLQTGDLVFFRTGPTTLHVGIMVGSHRFIHASTSQGVTVASLRERYWQERYLEARRVL